MDWENVFAEMLTIATRIIFTVCIPYALKLLHEKIHNDKINKYIDNAFNIVAQCVDFTNQKFVDGLKAEGKFGKNEAEEAFRMSREYVYEMLNENSKKAILEVFGDVELWIHSAIETAVRNSVNHIPALIEESVVNDNAD